MTELIPATRRVIALDKPNDWIPWLRQIKTYANNKAVWEYCDPDGTQEAPKRIFVNNKAEAVAAGFIGDDWFSQWSAINSRAKDIHEKVALVNNRIQDTVGEAYVFVGDESSSVRDTLIALREAIGYSPQAIALSQEKELIKLSKPPNARTDMHTWISNWRNL